jgi:ATP-dependent phosphofructokinase / diphosphate-dependent phosphofructokinase
MKGKIGIVVSGGPAPGINGVISAAANEAARRGISSIGLINGFKGLSLAEDPRQAIKELNEDNLWGIYTQGGSILGTSRFNPLLKQDIQKHFLTGLKALKIDKLIVIGGEGSAFLSYKLGKEFPDLQIVHIPKTIDNDLILPHHYPSFGFETARYVGTNILQTIKTDAKTCQRWFIVTSMGRKAGFLAMGLSIASGTTLTIIPEEFVDKNPTPEDVARIIVSTMKSRRARGRNYGVAVLAEGILDVLDPTGSDTLTNCQRDELGRIRYSSVELGEVLLPRIREQLKQEGLSDIKVNTKNIGYELRCHAPVSFDVEYTTFLGYGAVEYLEQGKSGIMVTREFDQLSYIDLESMIQADGTIKTRSVDLNSTLYKVATSFMSRG